MKSKKNNAICHVLAKEPIRSKFVPRINRIERRRKHSRGNYVLKRNDNYKHRGASMCVIRSVPQPNNIVEQYVQAKKGWPYIKPGQAVITILPSMLEISYFLKLANQDELLQLVAVRIVKEVRFSNK